MRALLSLALLTSLSGGAWADDRADADRLFAEGRALIEASKPDVACLKFRESFAKDRHAVGTLLNLGLCNERQGKISTAVVMYREAAERAVDAKLDASRDAAQERIAILTPLLPELTITLAGPALDGQKLVVDDEVVAPGTLPLDPGEHVLLLTAPGRLSFRTTVRAELGKKGAIELPGLRTASARRLIGKITVGVGGGLVAIAAIAIAIAKHDYAQPFDSGHCMRVALTCDPGGQHDVDAARSLGTVGSVVGVVGLAAIAGGAVLWLTAPHAEGTAMARAGSTRMMAPAASRRMMVIVPTGSGIAIIGRF